MKKTPIAKFESVIDSAFDKAKAGAELLIENELSLIKCILIKHETAVLEVMKELHDRATAAEAKCAELDRKLWATEESSANQYNRAEVAESRLEAEKIVRRQDINVLVSNLRASQERCSELGRKLKDVAEGYWPSYTKFMELKLTREEESKNAALANMVEAKDIANEAAKLTKQWQQRAEAAEADHKEVVAWAADMLVYLDVESESLPESEYKIYEEGYDKTVAGLTDALRALKEVKS